MFVSLAHALPMFREGRQTSTRKQEEKARKDPVKSHRPDLPVHGPGKIMTFRRNKVGVLKYFDIAY